MELGGCGTSSRQDVQRKREDGGGGEAVKEENTALGHPASPELF